MENKLVWNKRFNIGVELIDEQHQKLFRILNKLFGLRQQTEKSHWLCQEAVKYFKEHTCQHFADEEAYMTSIDYAGLETHRHIHNNFRERTLPALEKELELTDYSENSINHFLGVCVGWLVGHTLIEDHMIVSGETIKQWEQLLTGEEQAVMEQIIANLLYKMFQLESELISDCYGGEKFGNGIYYRLICCTKEQKCREFFFIFEEQLIVSTVGNVLHSKNETINDLMINTSRFAAQQMIEHIKKHFSNSESFDIVEEQLLTYEQFQKIFEKLSPQFSLLFDTKKGYFAFCMTSSDKFLSEDDVSILTENAMTKVAGYLKQNETIKAANRHKRKVMVVDDSDFILLAMHELLGNDYEVLTAKSGLSTIRGITLDRPDLILLDYEMPVCNGSQVLEMIRSENDFADIPVIFLTSRVDRECVRKVIALKPDGYLSKSLPPEIIKKEIDRFFDRLNPVKSTIF